MSKLSDLINAEDSFLVKAVHSAFPWLMADLEIYVNGIAGKQVQSANAIVDAVRFLADRRGNCQSRQQPGTGSYGVYL